MSFITATRQNIRNMATLGYSSGNKVSYDLSRVGLLARVTLRFKGTLTSTHATKTSFTKAVEAPWNLAKQISLTLNNGTSIWNTSGYGAYLQNLINRYDASFDNTSNGSVFKFGNTVSSNGTDNDIMFSLNINVALNDRDATGLLLLQSSQVVATVNIENGTADDLMTDADIINTLTGNWYVSVEFFNVPNNAQDWPVLNKVHQVLEDVNTIHATGESRFVVPRGNTYLKIINAVKLNGSYTDTGVEKLGIKLNETIEPYAMYAEEMKYLALHRYGRQLPSGVFVYDFFFQGEPNLGNPRDLMFSDNISQFDQYINIASGTTLGQNNNNVKTIRDMLVQVQATAE